MKTTPHSYSRIRLALSCPLAYRNYLNRESRGTEEHLAQVGSLVHLFAERYASHCMAANTTSDLASVERIARGCYGAMLAEYSGLRRPFLGELAYIEVLDELIRPFAQNHLFDATNIVEVESFTAVDRSLTPCAWDDEDTWVRARLDLVTFPTADSARVTDYKTGFNPEADPLQMQIYAWLMLAVYQHLKSVECELDYVRFNVQKYQTYTREQFPWLDERIRGILAYVESIEDFPAAPGIHCLHCDYRAGCPAKATIPNTVASLAEAHQAVEAISLLQRDLEDAKAGLRQWCVDNGPVEHNGTVWGVHAQGGMGYDDAKEFAEAALIHNINPYPYLTVNGTKTKTKKAQQELKPLAHLLVNKRSTVFAGKKAGREDS